MNIEKTRKGLLTRTPEQLANQIINGRLNRFVAEYADFDKDEHDPHGFAKRIPYIGWYWREVDFANGYIRIGNCGEFIGFMENNKWGYTERVLTPDEAQTVIDMICEAYRLSRQGGILADIEANTKEQLDELWPTMQTFPIEIDGYWIYGPQGQVGFAGSEEEADSMVKMLTDAAPSFNYRKVKA